MKVIYKKTILVLLEFIIFSINVFSASVKVWVMPTDGKHLNKTDSLWLPDEVHKKLRENMTNYSGLIVAEENNDELAKTQAKSYNENIREQDIIRMGKQRGANYVVLSSITAIGSAYSVNVLFQELESGKHLAESNKRASNKDDLYKIPGSAVDEAFIEICEVLNPLFGTGLSPFEKQELRKGKRALSDEENIKYLENEKKKIEEELKKINDELKAISFSTEMDAEIKRAQLELEQKQEEVKLEVNKQRRQNLLQEEENRKNDLANFKKLSAELQKRENEELEKLRDKVDVAIKRKVDAPRLFEQINQIEAKKNILIKIRNDRITETERIIEEEKAKILKREKAIMEEPLPVTQINSETGDMMPAVRKAKEMEVQQEVERIQNVYIKHLSNINILNSFNLLLNFHFFCFSNSWHHITSF